MWRDAATSTIAVTAASLYAVNCFISLFRGLADFQGSQTVRIANEPPSKRKKAYSSAHENCLSDPRAAKRPNYPSDMHFRQRSAAGTCRSLSLAGDLRVTGVDNQADYHAIEQDDEAN